MGQLSCIIIKKLWIKAGVDIDSIKTWDDYVEAGKKVVENTDAFMTNLQTGDIMQFQAMIAQQGSDFTDKEGNITLDNDKNIKTLQFLSDMLNKHKIAEVMPGGEPHAEEYYAYMNEGKAASVSMPLWFMGRFTDYMPDLKGKMVIRPLPSWEEGGGRSVGMGGTGTVVTNQTKHPELAKEFLAFAKLSKEGNIKLWTVLGFDPPRWDVWEDPAIREDNKFYQYFGNDIFDTLLSIKDEIPNINVNENYPDAVTEIGTNTLNNVLRQNSQTPKEALKQAQETVEANTGN
ncbi:extracellular solute-binding protein [Neobacillus vireti]